jgi:catechol 2,3-dioxygenase-like lactoylglutathione lyase family enzyme
MLENLPEIPHANRNLPGTLELGAFSVSLSVEDLDASQRFYEALGFEVTGGDKAHNYLVLKNGESTLGLFCGMFEGNILTFNPGLTGSMERIKDYQDVRAIERSLGEAGIELIEGVPAEAGPSGPAHLRLTDPDGNTILIDQFF